MEPFYELFRSDATANGLGVEDAILGVDGVLAMAVVTAAGLAVAALVWAKTIAKAEANGTALLADAPRLELHIN